MYRYIYAILIVFLAASHGHSQGDAALNKAFKAVEEVLGQLKVPLMETNNYFFYNEKNCTGCRNKLKEYLENGDFGSRQNHYVICNVTNNETYEELRKMLTDKQVFLVRESSIFSLLGKALKSSKDLYLIKLDGNKKVNIAAKLTE
jgi:hypothetical protein